MIKNKIIQKAYSFIMFYSEVRACILIFFLRNTGPGINQYKQHESKFIHLMQVIYLAKNSLNYKAVGVPLL